MADIPEYEKHPREKLDYKVDWSNGLETDETIQSHQITVEPAGEMTVDAGTLADAGKAVVVWAEDGALNHSYLVTFLIVTTLGRVMVRTIKINVGRR